MEKTFRLVTAEINIFHKQQGYIVLLHGTGQYRHYFVITLNKKY